MGTNGSESEGRRRQVEGGLVLEPPLRSLPPETRPLAGRMATLAVPGASIAVVHDGEVAWARGYGVREAGGSEPVTTRTLFQACSLSKPVTAIAALRLAQEGRLDPDEDVNRYLRGWTVPPNGGWRPRVTLRQLLTHSAGTTVHGFPGYRRDRPAPTLRQVLDGDGPANTPPVRVNRLPGLGFRYSGGGTTIVQQLLMDVTGLPFADLMRALVLDPLGMADSTFAQPLPQERWGDAASGHDGCGAPLTGGWHVYPEQAAAGLWTTPADLARVVVELQRALRDGRGALLTRETVEAMLTPPVPGRMGIFAMAGAGEDVRFGHGGDNVGYKCALVGYARRGLGAVVMTNGDMGDELCREILGGIALAYGWPLDGDDDHAGTLYPPRTPAVVGRSVYQAHAGAYAVEGRPDLRIDVTAGEDGLSLRLSGQPPLALHPSSDAAYYADAADVTVAFLRDDAGATTGLTLRQEGAEVRGHRLP